MSNIVKDIESIKVLIGPHMTEKAYADGDSIANYVFKVEKRATKPEIKTAVEKLFDVQVHSVNTVNVKGKSKSFKQKIGKRKSWKKAYVQLKQGCEIDFVGATEKG